MITEASQVQDTHGSACSSIKNKVDNTQQITFTKSVLLWLKELDGKIK